MGALIDASVLVTAERGTLDLDDLLAARGDQEIALAAITAAEILHGVHRSTGRRRLKREAFVERLLEQLPIVSFEIDVLACACGGRLRFIATIEDPPVVQRILRHLGLPTAIPEPAPARPPPTAPALAFDFPGGGPVGFSNPDTAVRLDAAPPPL
jgi:predicted nucleic acid-binding protein